MLLLGQLGWLLFLPLLSLLSAGLIVWLAGMLKPSRRREASDFISDQR